MPVRSVVSSAKLIAVCTLTSRVTGLLRDMLLVQTFGLTWTLDAFNYGFQIPNLFRRWFGEGGLALVFVPTFARTLNESGPASAWKLLARTLALLCIAVLAVVAVIGTVIAALWWFGAVGDESKLILRLTAIMLPFMLTICVVALFSSILNCLDSFAPAALTPLLLNLFMIGGLFAAPRFATDPAQQATLVAMLVVVAGVVQVGLLALTLRGNGARLGWQLAPRDPQVRRMIGLMLPVLLGQGVLLFGTFLDAQLCTLLSYVPGGSQTFSLLGADVRYPLEAGALSALTVAQRLYQFPLGVLGVSLAVAALPTLSRLAAARQWGAWSGEVRRLVRLEVFVGVLAGGMIVVLAEPIVRLLFEYGKVSPADTTRAASVLRWYGVGLWAFCAQHVVMRGFYSIDDVRTPVTISCLLVPLNVLLSFALVWMDGVREAAFAISTAATSTLTVIIGLVVLRKRTGRVVFAGAEWSAAARMLVAGVAGALVVWLIRDDAAAFVRSAITWEIGARAVETLGLLAVGTGLTIGAARLLRLSEPVQWLTVRRRTRSN